MYHMRGSQNELKLSNSGEKEPSSEVISANVGFIYKKSGLQQSWHFANVFSPMYEFFCQCIFQNYRTKTLP